MESNLGKRKTFAKAFERAKKRELEGPSSSSPAGGQNATRPQKKKKKRPPKKRQGDQQEPKKKRLSQGALDLSDQLKNFSQRKQLAEALALYWDKANDDIRDGFHACITIDCCARCGAMDEVDKILEALKKSGQTVSIETNTSAIKGFVHGGDIPRASSIFESMCQEKNKTLKPNVRTLNTLLRGCLWTAAIVDDNNKITGGVITSESAWKLYQSQGRKPDEESAPQVDLSSYEYTISLLCQALRTEEAEKRIEEMKQAYDVKKAKHGFTGGNSAAFESLGAAYLGLGRANALLGNKTGAVEACSLARGALEASRDQQASNNNGEQQSREGRVPGGEKRAWKGNDDRRQKSNELFRNHRLKEFEFDLKSIVDLCEAANFPPAKQFLAARTVNGLFYFSGGGTTKMNDGHKKENEDSKPTIGRRQRRHVINSSWLSFGLQSALKWGDFDLALPSDFIRVRDADRIFRIVGETTKAIQDDGLIDFNKVFQGETQPIDIELGSGHGDWIVHQAEGFPDRNHVAIELRADRVHQIFSKGVLRRTGPLQNLCVVGDDCGSFLVDRVKPNSVANIFANHPEPPTQVIGKFQDELQAIMEGGVEPAHMLNSNALIAAGNCLDNSSGKGRIVIVTDNMNYARLLCATVVKISRQSSSCLQSCTIDSKRSGLREVEAFSLNGSKQGADRVVLLEGQPSAVIGHAQSISSHHKKGSSYFDRLWQTGANVNASRRERYIIVLEQSRQ